MGRLRTISRRSFLVGSAAVMGGVAFGTYVVQRPYDNPLSAGLGEGEATFNPWVHLSRDKITLIVPHADLGQGVAHTQAALIAEELDVEFGQFDISFGVPSPAYWNTGMAQDGVPFMATDERWRVEAMRSVAGGVTKVMGLQGTGGSSSMPDSYEKLRHAGAVARETLKLAAAKVHGGDPGEMKTAAAHVILKDGTEVAYVDLVEMASTLTPVEGVTLRDPSDWRMIGKPMQRLDMVAKVTGTLPYGIDLDLEGIVHATVVCKPRQGGP